MPSKTNEDDTDALMRAFGAPADDWRGAGLRRRTGLPKDANSARRNFSAGGVTEEWDVSSPGTPNGETDIPLPQIRDRGSMGFSGTIDFGPLGRPQRPGKP